MPHVGHRPRVQNQYTPVDAAQGTPPCDVKAGLLEQRNGRPKDVQYVRSFLFLVVRPGAPSIVLAPSSDARSP